MSFLPKDYQAPKSSNSYMKLQDGENKIRILSSPIMGWEDWLDNKPIRYRMDEKPSKPMDAKKPIRHFWAFIVWNYMEERIQILQLTQASIRNNIEALCKDEDWGDPFFYDIKIKREGEGKDTEYMVNPLPHKPAHEKMIEVFNETPIYLDALFENGDPMSAEWGKWTPGIFKKDEPSIFDKEEPKKSPVISVDQYNELLGIFEKCDPAYLITTLDHLKKFNPIINDLSKLPLNLFERVKSAATKEIKYDF